MIFDTRIYLNDEKLMANLSHYLLEAKNAGVTKFLCIGYDIESSKKAIELANKYEEIYAAIGVIPTEHKQYELENQKTLRELETLLKTSNKILAIGEIGLDYYWEKEDEIKAKQKKMFIEQIGLANKYNLPISIHCRDAIQDCYDILKENRCLNAGIMHCYSGSKEMAFNFIKLGYDIAFGGVLTFKNSVQTKDTILHIPLDKVVFETDAPYLAPTPYRGKINEPKYIYETVKFAANLIGVDQDFLESQTYENACKILHVKRNEDKN